MTRAVRTTRSRRSVLCQVALLASWVIGATPGWLSTQADAQSSATQSSATQSSAAQSSAAQSSATEETSSLADTGDRSRSDRPVIGIASLSDATYIRAVRDAGGIPIVLPNTDGNAERIEEYVAMIDGLLMPGGADIPPSEYGEEPHESVHELSDDRYTFERDLCRIWIEETDKPLLGICLGSQWINVASGGSLIQDIPTHFGVNHRGVNHRVSLDPDSRLRAIFDRDTFEVNSSHHQSVGRLGRNLRIVAASPDGVIEATETTDPDRFLIGVQWHPERLVVTDKDQAKLFQAFIKAARGHKSLGKTPPAEAPALVP